MLQNSLDARAGNAPVEVDFDLIEVGGPALSALKEAIAAESLLSHMKGSFFSADGRPTESDLQAFVEGPLLILRITDHHTTGLFGPEKNPHVDRMPFASLTKDLFTANASVNAGGSYGIGKAVLWMFNQTRTVLFLSRVASPELLGLSDRPEGVTGSTRFIGRTELRQRNVSDAEYLGSGWLCGGQGQETKSVWDLPVETLRAMGFDPAMENFGTQMIVLGLSQEIHPSDTAWEDWKNELRSALLRESAEWFWPAIAYGRLRVRVDGVSLSLDDYPEPCELAKILEITDGRRGVTPGVDSVRDIEIPVPSRIQEPRHEECHQVARLALRKTAPGNDCKVALFRHPGMVVRYWSEIATQGNGTYLGVLPCGTFFSGPKEIPDCEDHAQFFLRMSENETHDQWTAASRNLEGRYPTKSGGGKRTPRSALTRLNQNLKDAVQSVVAPPPEPTPPGKSKLLSGFRLPKPGDLPPSTPNPEIKEATLVSRRIDQAEFLVTIHPRKSKGVKLAALRPTDENSEPLIIITREPVSNCTISDGFVKVDEAEKPLKVRVAVSLSSDVGPSASAVYFEVHEHEVNE